MLAGDDVVVGPRFRMAEKVEGCADSVAERAAALQGVALFRRRHRLETFDHRRRDRHHFHLQAAVPAERVKNLFVRISLRPLERKFGIAAGGAGDLV